MIRSFQLLIRIARVVGGGDMSDALCIGRLRILQSFLMNIVHQWVLIENDVHDNSVGMDAQNI